ncbi:DUF255 domain-containing protein [Heliobacterium gestii]|uniref:DUF255 domain-containing protein n=1 Tax=Heliomicrobium gestii TaxID=2699 RepID=A0A845LGN5_HELGE|nr:DUF255 domain-containing protein [Heliomicrobium gestii]
MHATTTTAQLQTNRLTKSPPYLLQHAYNPVDWHPWGDEAFKKAKQEDKPVFLSIGDSSCHWRHAVKSASKYILLPPAQIGEKQFTDNSGNSQDRKNQ